MNPLSRLALLWHEADSDARMHYGGFLQLLERMRQLGFGDLAKLRVLDIGCGERAPLSLLLAAHGAQVDALDLVPVRLGWRRPGDAASARKPTAMRGCKHNAAARKLDWPAFGRPGQEELQ